MDNLYHKVKLYLEANSKTWDAEKENIELRDNSDGKGAYIFSWNVSGVSKPTDSQLNSYTANATKAKNNLKIQFDRKNAYGNIGDQLDLLYKDIVAGKLDTTGEWAKKIKAVKDANAKE
jgi:hypothetical protein